MKYLNSFKLFEAKEKIYTPKLEGAVLSRLVRGKDQGYIKNYDIDFDKKTIKVEFIDAFSDQDRVFNMKVIYPYNYAKNERSARPIHSLTDEMHEFTGLMNTTAAKFVKMGKVKGVVDENGKVHSELDLVELLKDTPAMKKLTDFLQLTPKAFKNGKIEFFTRNQLEYAKADSTYKISPSYSISKGGKIYLLRHPPTTLQSMPPLNSLKDYEKACEYLFYHVYTKKLEKWRGRYEKDPSIISKIPQIYLMEIAPKLADATKIGIFDADDDD